MIFERDVAIVVGDGTELRANLFRPSLDESFPAIVSMGIYGKDVHFADAYKAQWEKLNELNPAICDHGSSGRYLRWELPDPERWTSFGYAVVVVDSRGSGKSPGYLDPFSPRETQDYYEAIEWTAGQPWSNGKVGLLGISYYAIKQWQVAALQPPHLAAICPWEGGCDLYRDWSHHGGIFSNVFPTAWYPRQVLPNQHGNSDTHFRDAQTGERTTGSRLGSALLEGNRADHPGDLLAHPLDDAWYRQRSPDLSRINVPILSAGNWGGAGLHLRGNLEGFVRAASRDKWCSMHVGTHFESFYDKECVDQQRRFFDRFLKDEPDRWNAEPRIALAIRSAGGITMRSESEWPLARTIWSKFFLDARRGTLTDSPPDAGAVKHYAAMTGHATFTTAPFVEDIEFTGPLAARLCISSTSTDMDIFVSVRMFDSANQEVVFTGASDLTPVARGWLRASHRKLDERLSTPYRPYHTHDEIEKLVPGDIYAVDVEIWPTSIVYPKGFRLELTMQGTDFTALDQPGRILHNHPADRPASEFDATNAIHTGPDHISYLLLPLIPSVAK